MQKSSYWLFAPLCICIVMGVAFFLHTTGLKSIGAEYDEFLSVNSVLNCPNPNVFLSYAKRIRGICIPIMLMPYIGSPMALPMLLARLFTPFEVFDVRLINQLLLLLSTLVFSYVLGKWHGRRVGILTLLFLLLDPPLLFSTSFESITVFPYILRLCLSAALLYCIHKSQISYKSACLIGFLIGFMIWTKVDAIFFISSLFLGIVVTKFQSIQKNLKASLQKLGVFVIALLTGLFPFLLYLRRYLRDFLLVSQSYSPSHEGVRIEKIKMLVLHFISPDFFHYLTLREISLPMMITAGATAVFLLWILCALYLVRIRSTHSFLAVSFFVFILLYVGFGGLILAHHRLLLYPIPQLLTAFALIKWNQKIQILIIISTTVVSLGIWSAYQRGFNQTCGDGGYTCAIDNVYRVVAGSRPVFTGDWGIATQLLFFSDGRQPIFELAFNAESGAAQAVDSVWNQQKDNCPYLVLHTKEKTQFPKARSLFASKVIGIHPIVSVDRFGSPQFETYDLCASPY